MKRGKRVGEGKETKRAREIVVGGSRGEKKRGVRTKGNRGRFVEGREEEERGGYVGAV